MSSNESSTLQKSLDLIRAGKAEQARPLLVELLRNEPDHAQAWFLLSYVLDDPQRKQYALQQALKADPQFERAQQRLRKLRGEPPLQPATAAAMPTLAPKPAAQVSQTSIKVPASQQQPAFSEVSMEDELRTQIDEPTKLRSPWPLRILGLIAVIALFGLAFVYSREFFGSLAANRPPAATVIQAFRTLQPTWTPGGLSAAATLQPNIPGSEIPTMPLDQAALNRLALISQQVDLLRDLPSPGSVPPILVAEDQLSPLLTALYSDEIQAARERDEGLLRALGFLDSSQTLTDYGLSSYADPYGGVYAANPARVYLIGSEFSDLLAYAYSRQYAKAIVDRQFAEELDQAQACSILSDSCRALRAFINGDWEITGEQWLSSYAAATTFQEVEASVPSRLVVQTEPPSDFALADLEFISQSGLDFVRAIFASGGWEQVNGLYDAPPSTSEQILHPEKFAAGEGATAISDPDLGPALGEGWTKMGQGSLGEWLTYLMLTQDANTTARIDSAAAQEAAAGWGGDGFQVYVRENDALLVSSMHWAMESDAQAIDLQEALNEFMTLRFVASPTALGSGACWRAVAQQACLFRNGDEVLLVQVPDEAELLQSVLGQFPDFQ